MTATDPATTFEAATDTAVRLAAGHAINVLRQRLEDAALDENPRRSPAINAGAGLGEDRAEPTGLPDQPNPEDPIGEEAMRRSKVRADLTEMHRLVTKYAADVLAIRNLYLRYCQPTEESKADLVAARNNELKNNPDDEWCKSCSRVGVLEPVTIAPDGQPYYAGMCRWCGQMVANLKGNYPTEMKHRTYPPKELLTIRHEGRRVYDSHIRAAFGLPPVSGKKAS